MIKIRNPIVCGVFIFFVLVNLLDSFTTFFILPGEANPIFLLTGSVWALIIFKFLMLFSLWWFYYKNKFSTHFAYFNFLLVLTMSSCLVLFASISNIYNFYTIAPDVLAAQVNVSAEVKIKSYTMFTTIVYILPYALSLLTFYLYDKSKKYVRFTKEQ